MNNQNSKKENPSPIHFSPTGGDLPPVKKEDIGTGTMEYNEIQEGMDSKTNDMVNHPKHYTTGGPIITIKCKCGEVVKKALECIEVIRDMPSWKGNAIKYLWRCGIKKEEGMSDVDKEIQDLKKAIWYIKDRIEQLKAK